MRALSDQMEPAPPHVQELRSALRIYRRAADEWRERARKAEAEVATAKAQYGVLYGQFEKAEAEGAQLKSDLSVERHNLAISEDQGARLRAILAGSDQGSVPNDFTTEQVARERMADIARAWDRVERGDARYHDLEAELARLHMRNRSLEADIESQKGTINLWRDRAAQITFFHDQLSDQLSRERNEVARLRAALRQAVEAMTSRGFYGEVADNMRAALAKGGGDGSL